jgi:hypothetical protein
MVWLECLQESTSTYIIIFGPHQHDCYAYGALLNCSPGRRIYMPRLKPNTRRLTKPEHFRRCFIPCLLIFKIVTSKNIKESRSMEVGSWKIEPELLLQNRNFVFIEVASHSQTETMQWFMNFKICELAGRPTDSRLNLSLLTRTKA